MHEFSSTSLIDQLIEVSRRYGKDPAYCLAGGGNTSMKDSDRLWVKASGSSLGEITASGFVEMERAALSRMLEASYSEEPDQREAEFMDGLMSARINPDAPLVIFGPVVMRESVVLMRAEPEGGA